MEKSTSQTEKLAKFYGSLWRDLKGEGFSHADAMRIILKEAKTPSRDKEKTTVELEKLLGRIEKGRKK